MNSYFRLRVQNFLTIHEDQLSDLCFSFGATGLSEALVYMQPDLTYDPDIIERKTKDIDVYFAEKPNPEIVQQLRSQFPNAHFEILEEQNKDWLEEWKKGYGYIL